MSLATSSPTTDLPPPTWQSWWYDRSKWFRIGCYAALGMVLLHMAIAVRIWIGLQEPAEIQAMRKRWISVTYAGQSRQPKPRFDELCVAGLTGKSWGNIVEIETGWARVTDDDLRTFGRNCRSLKRLVIPYGSITADGLRELARCRQLELLHLQGADLDDEAAEALGELRSLKTLNLSETLVSDAILPVLERLPRLAEVDVSHTDVTQSAVEAWNARQHRPVRFLNARTDKSLRSESLGSIRWSDGTRSGQIPASYNYRRWETCDGKSRMGQTSASGFGRRNLLWSHRPDGRYLVMLKIGDYRAVPVPLEMQDGRVSSSTFEFQMPCTRSEALLSAKY